MDTEEMSEQRKKSADPAAEQPGRALSRSPSRCAPPGRPLGVTRKKNRSPLGEERVGGSCQRLAASVRRSAMGKQVAARIGRGRVLARLGREGEINAWIGVTPLLLIGN